MRIRREQPGLSICMPAEDIYKFWVIEGRDDENSRLLAIIQKLKVKGFPCNDYGCTQGECWASFGIHNHNLKKFKKAYMVAKRSNNP